MPAAIDRPHQPRQQDEGDNQHAVVERKDAQEPPLEETAVVAGRLPGIEQDAGDQETRQDEEQLDAYPAQVEQVIQCMAERPGRLDHVEAVQQNQHDRHAAQSVQRGEMLT